MQTKISPYRISVQWTFGNDTLDYRPELTLAGSSRGVHSMTEKQSAPQVTGASIANCVGAVDYEHVRDRIRFHLEEVVKQSDVPSDLAAE